MTYLFGRAPAVVTAASPKRMGAWRLPSSSMIAPPLRMIAPATPEPSARSVFAALTIASTSGWSVMSPCLISILTIQSPDSRLLVADTLALNKTFLFLKFSLQSHPALFQPVTITDRVRLRIDQSLVRLWQTGQLSARSFLHFPQARERREDPAVAHHEREQRRARQIGLIRPGDEIA